MALYKIINCHEKFIEDDSISSLSIKQYLNSKEDIYPSISFCFVDPYSNMKLQKYGFDKRTYRSMLQGEIPEKLLKMGQNWTEKLYNISIDDISYEAEFESEFRYDTFGNWEKRVTENTSMIYLYHKGHVVKCFTIEVPDTSSIRRWKIYLRLFNIERYFMSAYIFLHFKNTLLVSKKRTFYWPMWKNKTEKIDIEYKFANILDKRSTVKTPCRKIESNPDMQYMNKVFSSVGCIPPFIASDNERRHCNQNQLKVIKTALNLANDSSKGEMEPCKVINVDWKLEQKFKNKSSGFYEMSANVLVHFSTSEFLSITQIQAYSFLSFLADVGSYAGLFLGFSVLQIPELLRSTVLRLLNLKKKMSVSTKC